MNRLNESKNPPQFLFFFGGGLWVANLLKRTWEKETPWNPGMKVMTCGWPTERNLEFRSIGVASSNMSWSKTDSFSLQALKCEAYNFLRLPQPNKKMNPPQKKHWWFCLGLIVVGCMASQLTWNKHEPKTKRLTACFETCQFAVARGKVEGNNCRKFQNISDFPRASNHTNRLLIDIFVKNFPKRTGAQFFLFNFLGLNLLWQVFLIFRLCAPDTGQCRLHRRN